MSLFSKEIRHKLAPVLKRHDIARAAIFGSFAVNQISEPEFFKLQQPQEAVIRRLEIIGEATKNLPADFRKKYSDVLWSEIARMRDKLIHGYFGVDLKLTFDIVKKDLPELKDKILKILKEMK